MKLPDGWNDYARIGKRINGTRFVAFKVPLRQDVNKHHNIEEDKQLYPKLLLSLIPDLGLVIDLTNTNKYYNAKDMLQLGIAYEKINVEGHKIPKLHCSKRFRDIVKKFEEENSDNEKLIGVHCTHGLNRTGFIIARYMIEEMHIPPLQAIAAFEVARGHKIERQNYTDFLKKLNYEIVESLAIDTDTNKGTQTSNGYWINETSIRSRQIRRNSNDIEHQVSLIGCVNIQNADLIPDGRGGFFVHIQKHDILPRTRDSNNFKRRLPSTPIQYRSDGNRFTASDTRRRRINNDRPLRDNKYQTTNNSVAENLLRMELNNRQRMFPPQTSFSNGVYGRNDLRPF